MLATLFKNKPNVIGNQQIYTSVTMPLISNSIHKICQQLKCKWFTAVKFTKWWIIDFDTVSIVGLCTQFCFWWLDSFIQIFIGLAMTEGKSLWRLAVEDTLGSRGSLGFWNCSSFHRFMSSRSLLLSSESYVTKMINILDWDTLKQRCGCNSLYGL